MSENCYHAFHNGLDRRSEYPLPPDCIYKLEEALNRAKRTLSKVEDVLMSFHKRGRQWRRDSYVWMRRLPKDIAFHYGHDVLPAIRSLADAQCRGHEYSRFNSMVSEQLTQVALIHEHVGHHIDFEYNAMRRGNSHLADLLDAQIEIIEQAIAAFDIEQISI